MLQAGLLTGDKQSRALDIVSRNVTSLTQIVEDVLDVSPHHFGQGPSGAAVCRASGCY
jgi:hypothetical protein